MSEVFKLRLKRRARASTFGRRGLEGGARSSGRLDPPQPPPPPRFTPPCACMSLATTHARGLPYHIHAPSCLAGGPGRSRRPVERHDYAALSSGGSTPSRCVRRWSARVWVAFLFQPVLLALFQSFPPFLSHWADHATSSFIATSSFTQAPVCGPAGGRLLSLYATPPVWPKFWVTSRGGGAEEKSPARRYGTSQRRAV